MIIPPGKKIKRIAKLKVEIEKDLQTRFKIQCLRINTTQQTIIGEMMRRWTENMENREN